MELGAFSISLSVKNLEQSKAFYEELGFDVVGGAAEQSWLIMGNGDHKIGLFQGMFEKNILTFNPGWNQQGESLSSFTDVRELQRELRNRGLEFDHEADEGSTGPASFVLSDPDGNPILIDQHI
jgi:catechol 2,3-dioxygenase-like lactoylglutathione lyase family enzyme